MRIFEKEYLGLGQQSEAEIAVKAALVRLYSVILRFLVKAKEYFGIAQSRADRFTQAISKRLRVFDKDMDDVVSLLQSEQANVYTAATLLGRQSQNNISLNMKQWTEEISQLQHTLKVIRNEDDKDRNIRILEWMSTQRHADVRLGRLEASGTWLINGTQFGDWAEAEASTILWLHGNPGVGKTKLVSKVVDELPERLKGRVAYFYCSRTAGKQRRNTAVEVFRSLARQLSIEAWPVISDTLGDLYAALEEEDPSRPRHPGMKEAIQVIYDVLAETPATLILDALDECVEDSRHLILDALFEMVDQSPTRIKVFISSRNYRAIAERLMDGQRPVLHVNVGAQEQTEDINRFIRHQVEQGSLTKFFAIHLTPVLQREIVSTLQDRAHGM
jgi:AAA ATPase domain